MNKVALVSGANQGLGFALVETLCNTLGNEATVYLTARDRARGQFAVRELRERGLEPRFEELDVSENESVAELAATLKARHGGVDIIISNAAARLSPTLPQAEQVDAFINTNNHGTYRMMRAFGPLLQDNARFIVVASAMGLLRKMPPVLHNRFEISSRSLEDIEQLMGEYAELVKTGQAEAMGWPDWINIPSKVAQVASTKIMAREMKAEASGRGILINAVCPGLVDTAASRPWFDESTPRQSPAEAATDVIWLATLPAGEQGPYGELVQHRHVLSWL